MASSPPDLTPALIATGSSTLRASEALFPNIASFPGQVLITPPSLSAKQEVSLARRDAVRAARHVERTNTHISHGIDRSANMVVGAALRPHAQPDWSLLGLDGDTDAAKKVRKDLARQMERAFLNWAYDKRFLCDAEGHYNFGGLMWLAFRNIAGPDAEVAGVIHTDPARRALYKTKWATCVQIVDPDRICTPPESAGDQTVYQGIKFDGMGRRTGMYVAKNHPSEGYTSTDARFAFVPRETDWGRPIGFHWFFKRRGQQFRGMTPLLGILKQATMFDSFDTNLLASTVLNQVMGTWIESDLGTDAVGNKLAPAPSADLLTYDDQRMNYYGANPMKIGPQRVPVLPRGDKLHMEAIAKQFSDPAAFRNGFLRQFASALGISFEQLSNNYSEANYSSARAALLEVWRTVETQRWLFSQAVAGLIWDAVIEEAIEIGMVTLPDGAPDFQDNRAAYTAVAFTGPGMGWIDPQKEANAMETLLRIGVTNRTKICAGRGDDFFEVLQGRADEENDAANLGIDLDIPMAEALTAASQEPDQVDEPVPARSNPASTGSQENA